jgi:hypothetical protein
METINKKELSEKLRKALKEEHLWTKDASQLLNMNPIYISMMLNSNLFEKVGTSAWQRLNEWAATGDKLSNFKIPEGEEIWKPKEKTSNVGSFVDVGAKPVKVKKLIGKKIINIPEHGVDIETVKRDMEYIKMQEIADDVRAQLDNLNSRPAPKNLLVADTLTTEGPQRIKIALDIEINLVLNGHRLQL